MATQAPTRTPSTDPSEDGMLFDLTPTRPAPRRADLYAGFDMDGGHQRNLLAELTH
jgi:hypothetical protein